MAKEKKQKIEEEIQEEELDVSLSDLYPNLANQIKTEYDSANKHMEPKRAKWQRRLRIYNNQTKADSKVGDPLLFVVSNTVVASLYDDKITVNFNAKTSGDEEAALDWSLMASHDYEQMELDKLDYEKIWDACFFGRALRLTYGYDKKKLCPIVEQLDPMTWQRDPFATSVNGDMNGNGAMRFGGRDIIVSRLQLKKIGVEYNNLKAGVVEYLSNNDAKKAKDARDSAQGRQVATDDIKLDNSEDAGDNTLYTVTQWFTHVNGQKAEVLLGNSREILLRVNILDSDEFPIDDCPIFPMSRDWDGVSIPDLIEDKQRARATVINLILDSAVSDLYPMYLYNHKKIRNKDNLKFEFNKFVGVNGDINNVVAPIQRSTVHQSAGTILDILDTAAQKAVAAPEIAQGIMPDVERTLGETRMVAQGRGARMNLHSAIFGWHDKSFWRRYMNIQKNTLAGEGLDKKYIRLASPISTQFRIVTKESLKTEVDPDIVIESVRNSELRKAREFNDAQHFTQIALQAPGVNQRAIIKLLGAKLGVSDSDMALIMPKTPDEMLAQYENESLNEDKYVDVKDTDDNVAHLVEHRNCNPTPAAMAHILAHQEALRIIKQNPGIAPAQADIKSDIMSEEGSQFTPVKKVDIASKEFTPEGSQRI